MQHYSSFLSRLTAQACDSTWVTSFYGAFFNIYLSGVLSVAGATLNCCCFSMFCVQCTTMHHVTSCKKPYTSGACVFSCNLPPALLAERPGSFTCYCSNTGGGPDTKRRVSTESWPWRRKFSLRSCRVSNPLPFDHVSDSPTTELSLRPNFVLWFSKEPAWLCSSSRLFFEGWWTFNHRTWRLTIEHILLVGFYCIEREPLYR